MLYHTPGFDVSSLSFTQYSPEITFDIPLKQVPLTLLLEILDFENGSRQPTITYYIGHDIPRYQIGR